jgi:hypothetical protein
MWYLQNHASHIAEHDPERQRAPQPDRHSCAFQKDPDEAPPMMLLTIDPLVAAGVVLATAATDAVYVMFTSAVVARQRVSAASWSSVWYLLSSFAVIHYTENWIYVAFAAIGSWIGAFVSLTFLRPPARPLQ